jgi:hypothetical protein
MHNTPHKISRPRAEPSGVNKDTAIPCSENTEQLQFRKHAKEMRGFQANYINALAVSVSPFFEPAMVTLGGLFFSPWVDFL